MVVWFEGTVKLQTCKRTSELPAPIMRLEGHEGELFTCKFSSDGDLFASAGHDKRVFLWRTFHPECENFATLVGHKSAVLELHWSADSERLVTASADKSVRVWDIVEGVEAKKLTEHTDVVNSCHLLRRGAPLVVSGAEDRCIKVWGGCTGRTSCSAPRLHYHDLADASWQMVRGGCVQIWDLRSRRSVQTLQDKYQVFSVCFADAGDQVYSSGIENTVKARLYSICKHVDQAADGPCQQRYHTMLLQVWDLRKEAVSFTLAGHGDSVTGMALHPDSNFLLTNSMDNTLRVWDVRPFAPANRCTKVFSGHQHTFEKHLLKCAWSHDGARVTAGSGDRLVHIWDAATQKLEYRLPGHSGSVNDAVFHPSQPIVASASSDATIFLGEIAASGD